jgi:hypothetical protein
VIRILFAYFGVYASGRAPKQTAWPQSGVKWEAIMIMMLVTAGVLFAVGFAGGYFLRAAMSWVRRNRMRKQRAEQSVDRLLNKTAQASQSGGHGAAAAAATAGVASAGQANA